ncbi:MAG: lysostaphin resistance A-like protein [Velocimicrobium sp.]
MKNVRHVNETFLITVLIAVVASFVFGRIPLIRRLPIVNLLLSQLIFVIPIMIYLIRGRQNVKKLLRFHKICLPNVALLIVFAFFISPLLSFLNVVSLLFTTNEVSDTISNIVGSYPLIISVMTVAMLPAVLEEIVYRGVFFHEYRNLNPRKGVILSAFLFGLMHMNFNQFFYAFVMGMIFAIIVEATDSILSSMIVHFTINASSVLLAYFIPKMQNIMGNQTFDAVQLNHKVLLPIIAFYGVVAVFSTIVAFIILKVIAANAKRPNALKNLFVEQTNIKIEWLDLLPLFFGIVICLGIMVYQQCLV